MKVFQTAALCLAAALPALSQIDLSGEWGARYHEDQPERIPGPEIGDYLGLPINDAARARADSWNASLLTLPEWQCRPHPADYGTRGPANLRIWKDLDPASQQIIAFHTHVQWQAQERTIWMDGRPHPPDDAPHTWQGFSTGVWQGDVLKVTTTHLKEGYLRRNGIPRSDRATLTEHWIRHGDSLTLVGIIEDPIYLTEPFIRSTDWQYSPDQNIEPYPCEVGEEIDRPEGAVPHHLPGKNPFLNEASKRFKVAEAATRGGAATMWPEYSRLMSPPSPAPAPAPVAAEQASGLHVQKVSGNVYMLYGAGNNITFQVGDEGVFVVDSGKPGMADRVVKAIREVSPKPIRYLIDTHAHSDATGGNQVIAKLGETIAGGDVARLTQDSQEGAKVIAHEAVLNRMQASAPFGALPTDIFHGAKKDLFFNGEGIRLLHPRVAHTDGDIMVFFRRSDVIAAGDVFRTTGYPMIDLANGGSIQGEIDALNQILGQVIPARNEEAGTYIVPGEGRLSDAADVAYYRDMVTIIRDRVRDMKSRGLTIAQVKAAKPTLDYEPRWGATSGPWTTDMFLEAIYQSLSAK